MYDLLNDLSTQSSFIFRIVIVVRFILIFIIGLAIIKLIFLFWIGLSVIFKLLFHILIPQFRHDFSQIVHFSININLSILILVHVNLFNWAHLSRKVFSYHLRVFYLLPNLIEPFLYFSHFFHLQPSLFHISVKKQTVSIVLFVKPSTCVEVEVRKTNFLFKLHISLSNQFWVKNNILFCPIAFFILFYKSFFILITLRINDLVHFFVKICNFLSILSLGSIVFGLKFVKKHFLSVL